MFTWFKRKAKYDGNLILNYGLDLAMQWGENWLQPIQKRLGSQFPNLTSKDLDKYNDICQSAMKFGHDIVYTLVEKYGKNSSIEEFRKLFCEKYTWVSEKNINHCFNQGMYYAWKDTGLK